MNREIKNIPRSGIVTAIGSKSEIQRYLLAAALSCDETVIDNFFASNDTLNAAECLSKCFAAVNVNKSKCTVIPFKEKRVCGDFDVGESATLLRLLLPICALRGGEYSFTMGENLAKRPHAPLIGQLEAAGAHIVQEGKRIVLSQKASASVFVLPADISSQYISGMLMAMPGSDKNVILRKKGKITSKPYIDLTVDVLKKFGINVKSFSNSFFISKNEKYITPQKLTVGGDWSNSSYFFGMGALAGRGITVCGLDMHSVQGDKRIIDILRTFGAKVAVQGSSVSVTRGELNPVRINADGIPDLIPIIAVLACGACGTTVINGTGRLRYKESDRVTGIYELILSLGGKVKIGQDSIAVCGTGRLKGGMVNTYADHRMIMAASAASVICSEPVTVSHAESINKSYPGFFEVLDSLEE